MDNDESGGVTASEKSQLVLKSIMNRHKSMLIQDNLAFKNKLSMKVLQDNLSVNLDRVD